MSLKRENWEKSIFGKILNHYWKKFILKKVLNVIFSIKKYNLKKTNHINKLNEEGHIEDLFDEIYSKLPKQKYPTNTKILIYIDHIWSTDSADLSFYKISNNKGFMYIFLIIDNLSKYTWAIPLK